PKGVAGFDRATIGRYLSHHYTGTGMIVGASGAVEHARIVDEAAARFAGLAEANGHDTAPAAARYIGGDTRLKRRLEQAHVVLGFEGLAWNDPGQYALHVFANAVGGGMSSRLFQEVRERRGLAYSIYTFHWPFADTGLFGLYAATGERDVAELIPVAVDTLAAATEDLTEAEVQRAKAQMKVSLLAALESPTARAEQVARQLLAFDRVLPREEMIARVEHLTLADIRAAGARALASAPTVAAIGPIGKVPTPDRIAERLAKKAA
ncbi:MAG: insulinase family protein, partial [Caulobacteraceae bacterium]|nr:insulinase family protein [Caulobacter sp.]